MVEKPVREKFEEVTDRVPRGPLGKVGDGNLVGGAGYFGVSAVQTAFDFIPGIKEPGYKITGHSTIAMDGFDRHVITVAAVSRNIAEAAARYIATPSNIDYLSSEVKMTDINLLRDKRGYSIYEITVDVAQSPTKEEY